VPPSQLVKHPNEAEKRLATPLSRFATLVERGECAGAMGVVLP
jgi:hypothetical protein